MTWIEETMAVVRTANKKAEEAMAARESELGRALTPQERVNLFHCTMCGEPNGNCTHGE